MKRPVIKNMIVCHYTRGSKSKNKHILLEGYFTKKWQFYELIKKNCFCPYNESQLTSLRDFLNDLLHYAEEKSYTGLEWHEDQYVLHFLL